MWAEVNGERKKVACGPCIRGHRSSKCDHRDRVLVEVRKPGRPLSSCPHPTGTCSCERIVINYTIPKSSECACPSERAAPTATISGNSRVQKHRRRSTAVNIASIEKAIQANQDAETDTSSVTRAPTERSGSHEATPQSSASSTPRVLPARSGSISSCCKPAPVQPVQPAARSGSCCSVKVEKSPEPEPAPVKSCCSGSKSSANTLSQSHPNVNQQYQQQVQYQMQSKIQAAHQNLQTHTMQQTSVPFGFGAPIYNHAAAAYNQPGSNSMSPMMNCSMSSNANGASMTQHDPAHNCHCGDSCSCFGCAAHPNNATMMEYVRLMAQFQDTGGFGAWSPPLYDMPTYPHHPGFGAEANQLLNFNLSLDDMHSSTPTPMNYHRGSVDMPLSLDTSIEESVPWSQPSLSASIISEPQYLEPSNYTLSGQNTDQVSMKTEPHTTDISLDGPEVDTPTLTLSPSSYLWSQMELPGCNDATGTCQCGDGCECVGCLTHGGHNGVPLVPLEPASLNHEQQTAFPNYRGNEDLHLADANDFVNMNVIST